MTYKAQEFIDAIPGTGGIISTIARRVGCKWHTVKAAIEKYPTVHQAYDDEREIVTDVAESTLIKAIRDGSLGAAQWWLTRKGKDRGFVERREVQASGPDGGPISISIETARDVREQLQRKLIQEADDEAEASSPEETN